MQKIEEILASLKLDYKLYRSDVNAALLALALAIPLGLLIFAVVLLLKGYVISMLWMWFVIPLFPTMVALTIPQAVGLSIFTVMISPQGSTAELESKKGFFLAFSKPLMALGIGYILTLFMS